MSENYTHFWPFAPVLIRRPSGLVLSRGRGASSDAARWAALKDALANVAASGDQVLCGPGTFNFNGSSTHENVQIPAGVKLRGCGAATIFSCTQGATGNHPCFRPSDGCQISDMFFHIRAGGGQAYPIGNTSDSADASCTLRNIGFDVSSDALYFTNQGTGKVQCWGLYGVTAWDGFVLGAGANELAVYELYNCQMHAVGATSVPNGGDGLASVRALAALSSSGTAEVLVKCYGCDFSSTANAVGDPSATVWSSKSGGVASVVELYSTRVTRAGSVAASLATENGGLIKVAPGCYHDGSMSGTVGTVQGIGAGSRRVVALQVFAPGVSWSTGDGKAYFHVPAALNGGVITAVHAAAITAGTTNTSDVQIARVRSGTPADVLSTKLTIDSTETGSDTAAAPAVINTANDDLATNDRIRIDVDAISTTPPQGLIVTLEITVYG